MRICIDIGGTKTLIAWLDEAGEIVTSIKFETPKEYADLVLAVAKALEGKPKSDGTIVIGAPGKIDRHHGKVIGFGNLPWKNVPLQADLEAKLGSPVRIENDANLAGLGEYYALNEHPHQCLYLTVSTGIGGGVVTDGRLDPEHLDSEPGEMLIEHNGQLVMFEKLASGSAIVRDYGKRASDLNDPASWHEICAILAHGIINILSMFKPNYIIIGGGVGTHFSKYKDILGEELKKIKPPLVDIPRIVQASRPEEAVILGAWQLAKQLDGEA